MYTEKNSKKEFLDKVKQEREKRALEKKRQESAIKIQAYVRGWRARVQYNRMILEEYDAVMARIEETCFDLIPAADVFIVIKQFLSIWKQQRDRRRFESLCKYIVASLDSKSLSVNFAGILMTPDQSSVWRSQVKSIMEKTMIYLKALHPRSPNDNRFLVVLLHTLVSFTSPCSWQILRTDAVNKWFRILANQICADMVKFLVKLDLYPLLHDTLLKRLTSPSITLYGPSLSAITILAIRPWSYEKHSPEMLKLFVAYMLSVPTYVHHLENRSSQSVALIHQEKLLQRVMRLMKNVEDLSVGDIKFKGNYLLSFTANFINLGYINIELLQDEKLTTEYFELLLELMKGCEKSKKTQHTNLAHWHPVYGWSIQNAGDISINEYAKGLKKQICLLWSRKVVTTLICTPSNTMMEQLTKLIAEQPKTKLRRALDFILPEKVYEPPSEAERVTLACYVFYKAINTFVQLRLDAFTGLCYQSNALTTFWKFFLQFYNNFKSLLRLVSTERPPFAAVPFDNYMFILFNECMTHYITILDDVEMYEDQSIFTIENFLQLSSFLNLFVYRAINNEIFTAETDIESAPLFGTSWTLLKVLYMRDCRRPYAPTNHWLVKELKASTFFSDLEKNKPKAKFLKEKIPHAISCKDRVYLFKKMVSQDKLQQYSQERSCTDCANGGIRVIRIRRKHIIEDAYYHMRNWTPAEMKRIFRVRFVNQQGLDEAGIDQAGVFKEFVGEFVHRVFDPSLNLFKRTSDDRVYPSPESKLHENYQQLFEFAGRILAKAIFEGITVDVRLASFFLTQILGQNQSNLYSYIDDLPSLDEELYRSLMYIKHYDGDVSEMDLTFSTNDSIFGHVVTYDLIPGGRTVNVTNENKIVYIHLMAHFKMYTQIKDQTIAFARGFHSLFTKEQLSIFSTPELQLVISGKDEPINLAELRQHTQYYGGFHDSHKVILWLWDILQNDFTEQERSLFLKFVTSCSKPPTLGFGYMHPPFSIRCVEVSEDEDTGDSVGSVIRGFFTIRKQGPELRLPTSSTCFNLLKLPNYSNKNILREKLRYAITSNTGFELS